jgi:hypothetical protein
MKRTKLAEAEAGPIVVNASINMMLDFTDTRTS